MSVHGLPSRHRPAHAEGFKLEVLKMEARGPESFRGAENKSCRFEVSKTKGPGALGTNPVVMLLYQVRPTRRAFLVGPLLWP